MNFRMWNYQIGFINYVMSIEKKIKINNSGATFNFSLSTHCIFDILENMQQIAGGKPCLDFNNCIDKPILVFYAHRF